MNEFSFQRAYTRLGEFPGVTLDSVPGVLAVSRMFREEFYVFFGRK